MFSRIAIAMKELCTFMTRATASALRSMPIFQARKDSSGVRAALRSMPVADRKSSNFGDIMRGRATSEILMYTIHKNVIYRVVELTHRAADVHAQPEITPSSLGWSSPCSGGAVAEGSCRGIFRFERSSIYMSVAMMG